MISEDIEYYLDNASTTRVDKDVLSKMKPYFVENYGNASSNHKLGDLARKAIDQSRNLISSHIGCNPKELIFTSGATESINLGIKGFIDANSSKGNHIISVKTEHKAVLNTLDFLESRGYEISYLDLDENGLVSIDDLISNIRKNTVLIVLMLVNNETGVIQPIRAITELAHNNGISVFTDATQAIGKMAVDFEDLGVDLMCFSAHKLNGPKGIGALVIKKGIVITPLFHGGGQEYALRPGTYNTPLIVGFGEAIKIRFSDFTNYLINVGKRRDKIIKYFEQEGFGVENFKNVEKVPHIISFQLSVDNAEDFLIMNSSRFVASTGSACNSNIMEVSHVIKELFDKNIQKKIVRISI
jgi:cysteine desulfurase